MTKRYHYNCCPDCENNIGDIGCQIEENGDVVFFKHNTPEKCDDSMPTNKHRKRIK